VIAFALRFFGDADTAAAGDVSAAGDNAGDATAVAGLPFRLPVTGGEAIGEAAGDAPAVLSRTVPVPPGLAALTAGDAASVAAALGVAPAAGGAAPTATAVFSNFGFGGRLAGGFASL